MTKSSSKNVAVLMGGWTSEREVSLVSGGAVCKALTALGHEVIAIDVQRDAEGLVQALTQRAGGRPDVVFNALHGRGGEDGVIQGFLELVGVPYTHSGVLASAIAMDKPLMKSVAAQAGVPCAKGSVVTHEDIIKNGYPLPPPFVIKPTNEGSSVGVRLVTDQDEVKAIEEDGWIYGPEVLIEEYIPGHELTAAVLGRGESAKALTVTELKPRYQAFYDYTAKYTDNQTDHLVPAPIPDEIAREILRLAVVCHKTIGCNGASRSDFRWNDAKPGLSGLAFLEINTQPGLTPLSLLPEQARHMGLEFNDLVKWLLENASCPA